MKKVYYLKTCNTCKRIIKDYNLDTLDFEFQNIKTTPISEKELEMLRAKVSSYADLFNRRAQKYRQLDKNLEDLDETQIKSLILNEYTFLKRPIIVSGTDTFIGNSKKVLQELEKTIHELKK